MLVYATSLQQKRFVFEMIEAQGPNQYKKELFLLTRHPVSEVRYEAVGLLSTVQSTPATILAPLLKDRAELVRINALEAIATLRRKSLAPQVILLFRTDPSYLVRSAAADAFPSILPKWKGQNVLEQRLGLEKNKRAKLAIEAALLSFDPTRSLQFIVQCLSSQNYRIRCASVNYLLGLAPQESYAELQKMFRKALTDEKAPAVRSTLSNALKNLKSVPSRARAKP